MSPASPSGPNIPEHKRRTVAVKVRCSKELAKRARDIAARPGMTLADLLEAGVTSYEVNDAGEP